MIDVLFLRRRVVFLIKFLRKPRIRSVNAIKTEKSMFQWGIQAPSPLMGPDTYTLSFLGMINGPLPKWFNKVLIVRDNNRLEIIKKWW